MALKEKFEIAHKLASNFLGTDRSNFDASELDVKQCHHLIRTHTESGWRIMYPLRARYSMLMREALVQKEMPEFTTKSVCPSTVHRNHLVLQHGFIGKVTEANRYECSNIENNPSQPFVYVLKLEYVAGNLDAFKSLVEWINNGCDRGHHSVWQGNTLRQVTVVNLIEPI